MLSWNCMGPSGWNRKGPLFFFSLPDLLVHQITLLFLSYMRFLSLQRAKWAVFTVWTEIRRTHAAGWCVGRNATWWFKMENRIFELINLLENFSSLLLPCHFFATSSLSLLRHSTPCKQLQ
jgi:hypothetical protein